MEVSFFVLIGLFFLAAPVLAVVALVKVGRVSREIGFLRLEIEALQRAGAAAPARETAAAEPVSEVATPATGPWSAPPQTPEPPPAATAETETAETPSPPQTPLPLPARQGVEQALAARWFVWVGGAAVALGGLLLVKYAHDNNLVPPALRVAIGLALAVALVYAGERLRRAYTGVAGTAYYVPAALSAAGLVIAFGVIYAAYALYGLLSPGLCFPALVLVGLSALWLSRRQGPLIAALGLVGSYAAPALVPSEHPSAWGFFAYLLVIVGASLFELRNRPWWWLGHAALGLAAIWSLLWLQSAFFDSAQALPEGLFALAAGAGAAFIPRGRAIIAGDMGSLADPKLLTPPMQLAIAGLMVMALVLAATVITAHHELVPLLLFAVGMAGVTGFGWQRPGLTAAPLLAALLALVILLAWPDIGFQELAMDERGFWTTVPGTVAPQHFLLAMAVALAAFTGIGAAGSISKTEPRPWAALAAASAVLFLFGAWARADFVYGNSAWALAGIGLAAVLLATAFSLRNRCDEQPAGLSVDMLVAGAAVLALFALDRLFDGLWYTLAIAALALAVAASTRVWPRLNIAAIASVLATFAAIRLFVSHDFWSAHSALPLGNHWPIYGYGVPVILFWFAARILPSDGFGRWRAALEGVALGLAISLVSLELRVLMAGSITADHLGLAELGAQALAWLGAAYGLAYRQNLFAGFISLWGARLLLVGSLTMLALGLTDANPVISGEPLQGGSLLNALWLAYLAPVVLLAFMARKLDALGMGAMRTALGVFALVLVMAFVTLLVKRQFQGPVLGLEFASQAESYAISLAWLVTGIVMFIAGLRFGLLSLRYGGVAVLIITILKTFGYDLFELGGLWRIASVIGLGACLIGVGWLYTRFVMPRAAGP